jgi:hypothetical protein
MQDDVDCQRQLQRRDYSSGRRLAVPDAGTCHFVGGRAVGVLDAELDVVQPGLREFGCAPLVEAHPTGDQIDVEI